MPNPDCAFDATLSTQVLEYVADVASALHEIARVTRSGGRFVNVATNWGSLFWSGGDADVTARILSAWQRGTLRIRTCPSRSTLFLRAAGFSGVSQRPLTIVNRHVHPSTFAHGAGRLMAAFAVAQGDVDRKSADDWLASLARADAERERGTSFPLARPHPDHRYTHLMSADMRRALARPAPMLEAPPHDGPHPPSLRRSPYAEKIRLGLGLKGLPWRSVLAPMVMPKPDLVELTGGYRRVPVLQVGADVFCDTHLIARVLDRVKPAPALAPPGLETVERALLALGRDELHDGGAHLTSGSAASSRRSSSRTAGRRWSRRA